MKVDYTKFKYMDDVESWFGKITVNTNNTSKEISVRIIDDMDDILPEQLSHFVQTDPEFGITIDDVKKIVHLLNN